MSPELYDAYRTAGIHVAGVWDWYLLQIDVYGLPVVLVWQLGGLLAVWCGLGGICHLAGRMREERTVRRGLHGLGSLEAYANNEHTRAALDQLNEPREENPQP